MTRRDAALVAAFEHGVSGDQLAGLVDLDLIGERLHSKTRRRVVSGTL
jgi:hypothetical protein